MCWLVAMSLCISESLATFGDIVATYPSKASASNRLFCRIAMISLVVYSDAFALDTQRCNRFQYVAMRSL